MTPPSILRLCTWNTWHGLNPYQSVLMLPLESPWEYYRRRARQIEELKRLRASDLDVFCLQEVNPLYRRRRLLQKRLGMKGFGCRANVGLKLAGMGFPPLLSEGLVTLLGEGFKHKRSLALTLSGHAAEYRSRLGLVISLQLSERRRALVIQSEVRGKRVAIVNLHIHHGSCELKANVQRRRSELAKLVRWIEPRRDDFELIAVCGDFNCNPGSPALSPLIDLGFSDAQEISGTTLKPSWNPAENRLSRLSAEHAGVPEEIEWDSQAHSFDRIYLRSRHSLEGMRLSRVFEEPLSDHFGILAEVPLPW